MPLIETTSGNETFPSASAKVQVFFVPTREFGGKELPLSQAAQAAGGVVRLHARGGSQPAGLGMNAGVVGMWHSASYDLPDGAVVKLFCHRSMQTNKLTGNQFIRMRAGAALREVRARLSGYAKAAIQTAVFRGRFDIISPEEAVALGARIPPEFQRFYTAGAVRSVFEYGEIAPEVSPRVEVKNVVVTDSFGEEKTIAVAKPKRKLGL
jgi:hypothetical protein